MNDSPAVHHVRISIYYVLWCDSGLPVRLAWVGYCLCRRCQTCGQMGTHLKRRGAKAIDKMKYENTLSVGLNLKVMHFR